MEDEQLQQYYPLSYGSEKTPEENAIKIEQY